ncbi:hypothetical protein [Nocardioides marmoribigeumensis]|uniref:SurA N-terminal domain-containing protein n=1 Tax=Nocardioides marmoribigeumensis TaxID=433649 RepID=A0ABU2BZJ1_9ACTN|nr:hypothetical protein [Nocardioides marmoribigeumensis]MDR7363821.1 hypothetical protein [Nocardioides marmoribigeumensis]
MLSLVESSRRRLAVVAVLVLPLSLSACGNGVGPGDAAEVDGHAISVQQVDDLARVICATQGGQQGQGGKTPTASVRAIALNVLIGIEVGAGIGDLGSVDQQQVSQSVQSAAQARAMVDEADRELFDRVVKDSTRSQLVLDAEAAKRLQASGGDPTDQNALQAEVAKVQADYVKGADVKVAPRFGRMQDGQLVAGDGSLSVPVSKGALAFKGGSSDDPFGTASTADFPASQRCS